MITCQNIMDAIEAVAPLRLAYDWDNCGLLVGDPQKQVNTVLTCLDCDMAIVEEAERVGADMILSHHPFFFREMKRFSTDNYFARVLQRLFAGNLCYYAAHTNMDAARGGMNDRLASLIGLPAPCDDLETIDEHDGFGRVYELAQPLTVAALCAMVKRGLGAEHIAYTGSPDRQVKRIGLCSGGGQGFADLALDQHCDVYITGDFRHDPARDYLRQNMSLILIRHYDSEIIIKDIYHDILQKAFSDQLKIVASQAESPVFQTFHD